MCHIPVFCWISAIVLEQMLGKDNSGKTPTTLTQMYTCFLLIQTGMMMKKYSLQREKQMIMKLGKLAFNQLQRGNLIFYEEDLNRCGIDVTNASVHSGLCTQIFKTEDLMVQRIVYSFVHLSIQEFLAALFVSDTYREHKKNLLDQSHFRRFKWLFQRKNLYHLHKSAVDKALESNNGHLDLFLRFLLGISLESNQSLLKGLLTQTERKSESIESTVKYIKKKIMDKLPAERSMNLFHCLNELNDNTLVEEIQRYLNSGDMSAQQLSPGQWSALVFVLLTSREEQDVFDLKKYTRSDEGLLRLMPAVQFSRSALLNQCRLTERCCEALASVLTSNSCSQLRELDLSDNDLQDSGVKKLSAGLENKHCKLDTLKLSLCRVTEGGCASLASALRSNPCSHLRELDLSYNHPGDLGVKLLSYLLKDPHCKLETLQSVLLGNKHCCASLASALHSNPSSHLKELDLSYNHPGDSGVKLLCDLLEDPHCQLEILQLNQCGLTERCCEALASVLTSNSCSYLRELDLSDNDVQDSGVKKLTAGLGNKHCKLEILRMSGCCVTEKGCASLASDLHSNPCSHLCVYNHPGDSGVKLLSDLVEDPQCKLETLHRSKIMQGPTQLSVSLGQSPRFLRGLYTHTRSHGAIRLLCKFANIHSNVIFLRLNQCGLTERCCEALASVLTSNSCSHLRELDLSDNDLQDSGMKILSAGLGNKHRKLDTLRSVLHMH
uniref:NACHT, LRR and PYD domains-containing protein 12-like n=1 Tax=Scleropages formosus TaxID=113540 RepID=A0A8C9SFB1_SCLFO